MKTAKSAPPAGKPSVFRFLDAREFLRAAYEAEKETNPSFSQRYIALRMKARSSSFFKDVLNGRIRINPSRAAAFARLFRLDEHEAEYFATLALYTDAVDPREREELLAKLSGSAPSGNRTILDALQLEYFQKWHYAAVREMFALDDFHEDTERIAELLDPPVTKAEVAEALQLLRRLKLVRKNAHGGFEKSDRVVSSGSGHPDRVKPAIRDNLHLALRALDASPPRIRPFSYLTLSLSEKSLERIRVRLQALRGEILDIVGRDDEADRLYQLNFQLFPLSKPVTTGKT
jgi:uncharacterized protein (TIGR02147 family)